MQFHDSPDEKDVLQLFVANEKQKRPVAVEAFHGGVAVYVSRQVGHGQGHVIGDRRVCPRAQLVHFKERLVGDAAHHQALVVRHPGQVGAVFVEHGFDADAFERVPQVPAAADAELGNVHGDPLQF